MANKYTIEDIIRANIETALMNTYTNIPAIIQSYNEDTQTATVTVSVNTPTYYGDNIPSCTLEDVPIIFPAGDDWVIAGKLVEGDAVMLIIPHYGIDEYLQGSRRRVADPLSVRRHDLNEAVAIPGMITYTNKTVRPQFKGKFYINQGANSVTMSQADGLTLTSGSTVVNLLNGVLTITSPTSVNLVAPTTTFTGNVEITGTLTSGGIPMNTHTHAYTDDGAPMVTSPAS